MSNLDKIGQNNLRIGQNFWTNWTKFGQTLNILPYVTDPGERCGEGVLFVVTICYNNSTKEREVLTMSNMKNEVSKTKDVTVKFRAHQQDKELALKQAKKKNLSMSEYLRQLIHQDGQMGVVNEA